MAAEAERSSTPAPSYFIFVSPCPFGLQNQYASHHSPLMGWSMLTNRQLMLSCLGTHSFVPRVLLHLERPSLFLLIRSLLFFFLSLLLLSPTLFPHLSLYLPALVHALFPLCLYIPSFFLRCSNLQRQIYTFHSVMMNKSLLKWRRAAKPTVWKRRTCSHFLGEECV